MGIVRKINALLMVGVVYAMSLSTTQACRCDSKTNPVSPDACCCLDCGSTQPEDSQRPSDCDSCCDCDCFYRETPIRAWKLNDDLVFAPKALVPTSLEPPVPVQASDRPADDSAGRITTHNVRQSQLCVWRK
jgi:hypothetical protein